MEDREYDEDNREYDEDNREYDEDNRESYKREPGQWINDNVPVEKIDEASSLWWDKLNEEERKNVFMKLIVEAPIAQKYIYWWLKEHSRTPAQQRVCDTKRAKQKVHNNKSLKKRGYNKHKEE